MESVRAAEQPRIPAMKGESRAVGSIHAANANARGTQVRRDKHRWINYA